MMKLLFIFFLLYVPFGVQGQNTSVKIALAKYGGGGDWYSDPTALPNLIRFCNQELSTNIHPEPSTVDVGSQEIFNYPFVHLTEIGRAHV